MTVDHGPSAHLAAEVAPGLDCRLEAGDETRRRPAVPTMIEAVRITAPEVVAPRRHPDDPH